MCSLTCVLVCPFWCAAKYVAGKELFQSGKVGKLQDGGEGKIAAEVQGSELYHVKVTLLENGEWQEPACSCPDGIRSQGKCKHVASVLLAAAAAGSNSKHGQDQDTVVILSDDKSGPPPAKRAKPQSASSAAGAAAANRAAGWATYTNDAKAPAESDTASKGKKPRLLPGWMKAGGMTAAKPTAGSVAAAKAAAYMTTTNVGNAVTAKRKTAQAQDPDDEDAPAPSRAPRTRPTGRTAPRKAISAPAVADLGLELDMCRGFLDDLVCGSSDGIAPQPQRSCADKQKSAYVIIADSIDRVDVESGSPRHAHQDKQYRASSDLPSAGKGKDVELGDARRSMSKSSQGSAVPDTPEPTPPIASWTNAAPNAKLGESSVQAEERSIALGSDSDDDVDPAEKFRLARLLRNKSQHNSQGSPQATLSQEARMHSFSQSDDTPVLQLVKKPGAVLAEAQGRETARARDAPAPVAERPGKISSAGARSVQSPDSSHQANRSTSPPSRRRGKSPVESHGNLASKPIVSLKDRMKALLG